MRFECSECHKLTLVDDDGKGIGCPDHPGAKVIDRYPEKRTITVKIVSRWDAAKILYAAEIDPDVEEIWRVRTAVEQAVKAGASLDYASLVGARLVGASLVGASLVGASLVGASLVGARLVGDLILAGKKPVLEIGPLGSRNARLLVVETNKGRRIIAGCFRGTVDEFLAKVKTTHGDNEHGRAYRAAIEFATVAMPVATAEEIADTVKRCADATAAVAEAAAKREAEKKSKAA
jgi:hypothetical protein